MSESVRLPREDEDEIDNTPNRYDRSDRYDRSSSRRDRYSQEDRPVETLKDIAANKLRWKNRRRMAWIALISMVILTGVLLFGPISETRIKVLSEPISWFYFAMASVIGAYMGFTTWASKTGNNSSRRRR